MSLLAGQVASGLDIKFYHNGVMTDPTAVSGAIFNSTGVPIVSGTSMTKLSTGFYNASTLTIPSGHAGAATISWYYTSPSAKTGTATEAFTITDDLTTSFNYDNGQLDDIIEDVKLDMGLTNEFTRQDYERFLNKALKRLNRKLRYTGTANALSYSSSTKNISPTPDNSIYDLILLQIECLISKERRRDAVGKGIRVKDGDTEIDTTASFGGHDAVVSDYCGELQEAIKDYLLHNVDSPADNADIIWYGSRKIEADMDHDGEGSDITIVQTSPFENRTGLSVTLR
jgi:hypothetical protein